MANIKLTERDYCWLIAMLILCLICIFTLVFGGKGSEVAGYIGFAGTIIGICLSSVQLESVGARVASVDKTVRSLAEQMGKPQAVPAPRGGSEPIRFRNRHPQTANGRSASDKSQERVPC